MAKKKGGGGGAKAIRIGQLVIAVDAETSTLKKKTDGIAEHIEKMVKRISGNFGKFAFIGAGAILAFKGISAAIDGIVNSAAAMKNMLLSTIENTAAQQRFADSMGMSIQAVQSFNLIAQRFGVDSAGFNDALKSMHEKIGDAALTGGGSGFEALNALGLDIQKIKELAPDQQFLMISDAISKLKNSSEQLHIADSLGLGNLLPMLQQGREKIESLADALVSQGYVATKEQAIAFLEAKQALDDFNLVLQGVQLQVAAFLSEYLPDFIHNLITLTLVVIDLGKKFIWLFSIVSPLMIQLKGLSAFMNLFIDQSIYEIPKFENPFGDIKTGGEKAIQSISAVKERMTELSKSLSDMQNSNQEEALSWKIGSERAKLEMLRREMVKLNGDKPEGYVDRFGDLSTLKPEDQQKFRELDAFARFKMAREQAQNLQFAGAATFGSSEAISAINQNRFTARDDLLNVNQNQLVEARTHTQLLKSVSESLQYMKQPVFK